MADQSLIQGAGRAAMGEVRLGAAKGLTKITSIIADAGAKVVKGRAKEFDRAAKEARERMNGAQTTEQLAAYYDEFGGDARRKYIRGNKKTRAVILQDMNNKAIDTAANSVDVKEWAAYDLDDDFKSNPIGESVTGIFDGTNTAVWNEDVNQYGYMINSTDDIQSEITDLEQSKVALNDIPKEDRGDDYLEKHLDIQKEINALNKNLKEGGLVWKSRTEIGEILENHTFDTQSKDRNIAVLNKNNDDALKGVDFNYASTESYVKVNVIDSKGAKYKSQIKHRGSLVSGRVFEDDLIDYLSPEGFDHDDNPETKGKTYTDLGIPSELIVDKTGDGKITRDDAKVIVNELFKDENVTKDYMARYVTNHLQHQHNNITGKDASSTWRPRSGPPPSNTPDSSEFNKAFAAHHAKMVKEHGTGKDNYKKWTNFEFDGKSYTPHTKTEEAEMKGTIIEGGKMVEQADGSFKFERATK